MRAKTGTDADEEEGQDPTQLLTHDDRRTTQIYLRGRKAITVTPLRRKLPK